MGRYRLLKLENGRFCFVLLTDHGSTLIRSQPFASRAHALEAIDQCRGSSMLEGRFQLMPTDADTLRFVLMSRHGKVIAMSHEFRAKAPLQRVLNLCKAHAPTSPLEDETDKPR